MRYSQSGTTGPLDTGDVSARGILAQERDSFREQTHASKFSFRDSIAGFLVGTDIDALALASKGHFPALSAFVDECLENGAMESLLDHYGQ